jgi:hypothetical protein
MKKSDLALLQLWIQKLWRARLRDSYWLARFYIRNRLAGLTPEETVDRLHQRVKQMQAVQMPVVRQKTSLRSFLRQEL